MRDIFIDNVVARRFSPPLQPAYKVLIAWLYSDGALVVSQKLLNEYNEGLLHLGESKRSESILGIIGFLTQNGRLNKISNQQLRDYRFKRHIENSLLCNRRDRDHLKTILLSFRKLAITIDRNLNTDINAHPRIDRIKPRAAYSPNRINYI